MAASAHPVQGSGGEMHEQTFRNEWGKHGRKALRALTTPRSKWQPFLGAWNSSLMRSKIQSVCSQRENKMPGTNMVQEKDFLEEGRLEKEAKEQEDDDRSFTVLLKSLFLA